MEGDGEDWTSAEDTEEERELEIALYSQIHFDAAPEHAGIHNYQFIDSGNASFNVGVEEISLPLKRGAMEKTGSENDAHYILSDFKKHSKFRKKLEHADNADTIYVTSSDDDASVEIISSDTNKDDPICNINQTDDDECIVLEMSNSEINKGNCFVDEGNRETLEKKKKENLSLSKSTNKALDVIIPISHSPRATICGQNSEEIVPTVCDQSQQDDFNDEDDLMILDAYVQLEESLPLNESNEKGKLVPEKSMNQISPNEEEKVPLLDEEQLSSDIRSEPPHTCPTTEKPKESCNILPFTITKATVQIDKKPSSGESDSLEKESPCTKVQDKKKLAGNKRSLKMASDKPGFLQFSENARNFDKDVIRIKKKKLSKQEAAVIPRKPPVLLRRPPVVKVSYQQDSDTNTDYSDSDISSTSTPKKVPSKRNGKWTGKSVREESRDSGETDTTSSSSSSEIENESPRTVSTSKRKCDLNRKSKLKKRKPVLKESEQSGCVDNEVESKETTSEESDTASSVSSHTADLGKGTIHNPALDFNIEGGVKSLLKSKLGKTDGEKWQITDQDRYQIPVTMSRYFSPLTLICRNCNKEGHKALACPEPKRSVCIFCGRMGHVYQACPDSICHNCNEPGHRLVDCRERQRGRRIMCGRCWMPGHFTEDCPDSWRQYHLTCGPDITNIQTASKKHFNPKVYCFNCGKEGHLGYECDGPLMNFHVIPNYPFIAKYNTGEPKENRNTRRKKEREAKEKKKKRYEQDFDQNKNHGEIDYNEEYWEETERVNTGRTAHGSKRKGHSHNEENNKIYKSGKGKKHQKSYTDKAGKHHSERLKEDRSHHSKKQIVTENTVFSFQNSTNQDYQEEDYGPPRKKRFSQGKKDHKNNRHPHHSAEQPLFKDYNCNKPYQIYDDYDDINGDDKFTNHQVFSNEWWKEDQSTKRSKRGKRNKSSRKNTASNSMQYNEIDDFGGDEMYSEHQMYQHHNVKRKKKGEAYESSRKHVSPHSSHQNASTSRGENYGGGGYHKPYYRHNKKKNKSGFQMNSHFQSLSKSCRRQ